MYGFAYKFLCEIDREGLNVQLSTLNNLSLKEFNRIESLFFVAFNCNISITEERFSNKIAALEKAAAAEQAVQILCSESVSSAETHEASSASGDGNKHMKCQEVNSPITENSNSLSS